MLDDNGYLTSFLNKILEQISPDDDIYAVLISSRRISKDNPLQIPFVPIGQLSKKATMQLLSKLAEDSSLQLKTKDIDDLSEYVNGYPPSAHFAIKQGVDYGADLLMSDKVSLVKFSTKRFISHINDQKLTDDMTKVLALLAGYSPLPLFAIAALFMNEMNTTHECIYKLIDYSLIRIDESEHYRIADPIKESVRSLKWSVSVDDLKNVKACLDRYIKEINDDKKLEYSRVLFRIGYTLNDQAAINNGISLKSDYIKLLIETYHQRKYPEAIKIGIEAVKECPDNSEARSYLVRSLIQEEKWDSANAQIEAMVKISEPRDIFYLRGFLERKRGKIQDAITAFLESEKNGRKGSGIKRELAHCYLLNDNLESAKSYIEEAMKLQADNNHVLDMAAKINIKLHDEQSSKIILDKLRLLDDSEHFHLRMSAYYYAFGKYTEAIDSAATALQIGGKRFFSGRVQHLKSLIKGGSIEDAKSEMNNLDIDFKDSKVDVRCALKCGIMIAENNFKGAYDYSNMFTDKRGKTYLSIKKKCLENMVQNVATQYKERQAYQEELKCFNSVATTDVFEVIEI